MVERRPWRRVAAIEQGMDPHGRDAVAGGELGKRDQMAVVGMDAARTDQADQVQPAVRSCRALARRDEGRPLEEAAVGDGRIDPRQVLEDRSPSAEVQVADLRVAHLPGRQPDGFFRGAQDRVWPHPEEPAPGRHRRGRDGIGRRIAPDAEPVEDDEDDRLRSGLRHAAAPRPAAVRPALATIPPSRRASARRRRRARHRWRARQGTLRCSPT